MTLSFKQKISAGLLFSAMLATPVHADVVFGVTGNGSLIEADSWNSLMNDPSKHINHGTSSVGWNMNHRYFMADGSVYGVDGRDHLMQYNSVLDLWNGVNFVDHGASAVGWSKLNQFFAHNGEYFGVSGSGTFVRSASALNLWDGIYQNNYGDIPNGWDSDNSFMLTSEGLYGLSNSSGQYSWSSGVDLRHGSSGGTYLGAQSPFGWSLHNQFFGDNSMNGIALNSQGIAIDASAPFALGALSLLGLAAFRRRQQCQ